MAGSNTRRVGAASAWSESRSPQPAAANAKRTHSAARALNRTREENSEGGLERTVAALIIADANRLGHVEDEDFAVADLTGACRGAQRVDHFIGTHVGHHHFHLYFGQQIYLVFHAAVDFLVPFLPAMPANFGDGHAIDTNVFQGFLDILKFVRLNDGFDLLHPRLLTLQTVAFLTVHAQVEPVDLFLRFATDADNGVAYLEDNKRPHNTKHPGNRRADCVVQYLTRVAVHRSQRLAAQQIINLFGREDAGKNSADRSPNAVHAERVQRIVIAELVLYDRDHGETNHTGYYTDEHGGHRLDEARCGRNGNQTRDGSRN